MIPPHPWTNKQLKQYLEKVSFEEIQKEVSLMNLKEIAELLSLSKNETFGEDKAIALLKGIKNPSFLEQLGKKLSPEQLRLFLVKSQEKEKKELWKLSPFLVGMEPEIFKDFFSLLSEKELSYLKDAGSLEPLNHQLTLLLHELNKTLEELENEIPKIEVKFSEIDVEEFPPKELSSLLKQIEKLDEQFLALFIEANKALNLSWHTTREDLIASFQRIQNSSQRAKHHLIGSSRSKEKLPTGLYDKLEQQLFSRFGNPGNVEDIEALKDEEPAIEALTKFSLWYLKDYFEIGLLPQSTKEEIEKIETMEESKQKEVKERFFIKVKANLKKTGLEKVKDLKEKYIFSKKALKEHLKGFF